MQYTHIQAREKFYQNTADRINTYNELLQFYKEYRGELEELCSRFEYEIEHDIIEPKYQWAAAEKVDRWTETIEEVENEILHLKFSLKSLHEDMRMVS